MIILFSILFICINGIFGVSVCEEKTFLLELREDLEDNGHLDCLRTIDAPHSKYETQEENNKYIFIKNCLLEYKYVKLTNYSKTGFGIMGFIMCF